MTNSAARKRVLVLGEDTRSFLAVIRSLGRAGLEVHAAWCPLHSPALRSRYIGRLHRLPEYRSDDPAWLEALNRLLREEAFDLVLPVSDGTILPLQMHREQIAHAERICLLPDAVYRICASKQETYKMAAALGIPVPPQIVATTLDEVRGAARRFGYPLVLKPQTSSSTVNPLARQAVEKVRRKEDLERIAKGMLAGGPVLVQQNFTGRGIGVEVLSKDGEVLTAFQHERVHEPLSGGGSSYRKSVPLDPGMSAAADRLMAALRYTGVAMVEFKQDPRTGAWVLIEINARFWGSLPLSIAAGLDFPRYLYQMLGEGRTRFPQIYRTNVYCRHWSADLQWLRNNLEAGRGDPDLLTLPWRKVAAEIRNFALLREHSDTFVWDDPLPAVSDLTAFFSELGFGAGKRMRWFRELARRRALKALAGARNILVVCHGNICRSPFAAAALQSLTANGSAVSSSGYFPRAQRRAPDAAAAAARRFGIDLATHRSRVLTEAEAAAADLIFVFERRHAEALKARFPRVSKKIHLFGALDPAGSFEIEDPYGGTVEQFANCYGRIRKIARSLAAHWPAGLGSPAAPRTPAAGENPAAMGSNARTTASPLPPPGPSAAADKQSIPDPRDAVEC